MISDQIRWDIDEEILVKCPKKERAKLRTAGWSKADIELFEREVNDLIEHTSQRVAPYKLQFGGFIVAALICIAATIVITIGEQALGGLLLFALGIIVLGAGFWYRDQLIQRKWKKIAQEMSSYFKETSAEKPGMQFEFHIRGHHSKKVKAKDKSKPEAERTSVWYERYIVLTLPSDDYDEFYVAPSKRASFRPMKGGKGNYQETNNPEDFEVGYSQPERQDRKFQDGDNAAVLPYWWLVGKDKEGRVYYINNFQKKTQWNPPTPEQISQEKDRMNEILPPPAFNSSSTSKQKFEEVKRRSIAKRHSLIKISRGEKPTEEEMRDVKAEDRPDYQERKNRKGNKKNRRKH